MDLGMVLTSREVVSVRKPDSWLGMETGAVEGWKIVLIDG
jgi:hypothetical protein